MKYDLKLYKITKNNYYNIESEQKKKNLISENSNWYEQSWLIKGEYAGFIQACVMPNIRTWINFEPAKIAQFKK